MLFLSSVSYNGSYGCRYYLQCLMLGTQAKVGDPFNKGTLIRVIGRHLAATLRYSVLSYLGKNIS